MRGSPDHLHRGQHLLFIRLIRMGHVGLVNAQNRQQLLSLYVYNLREHATQIADVQIRANRLHPF